MQNVTNAVQAAKAAAQAAAQAQAHAQAPEGYAYVQVYGLDDDGDFARALQEQGFAKSFDGEYYLLMDFVAAQNLQAQEAAADAAAHVLSNMLNVEFTADVRM